MEAENMQEVTTEFLQTNIDNSEVYTYSLDDRNVTHKKFLGIASNDWKDFIDPTLPQDQQRETAISMRNYNSKMQKAYLRGHKFFRYGYNGRDSMGMLIPRIFPVLMEES